MQTLMFLVLFSGSIYWMSASVFGNNLAEKDAVVVTSDTSRTPASPPEQVAPTKSLQLIPETIVVNKCNEIKGVPFNHYTRFGLGNDFKFYGERDSKLVPIDINPIVPTKLVDATPAGESTPQSQTTQPSPDQTANGSTAQPETIVPPVPSPSKSINKTPDEIAIEAQESIAAFKNKQGITEDCTPSNSLPQGPRTKNPKRKKENNPDCQIQNTADSYLLSMSWQPAFCDNKLNDPKKPECSKPEFLAPEMYHNRNFSLHGLWPNKMGCQQDYGWCGDVKQHESNFTNYRDVNLTEVTLAELGKVMPSVPAQSMLQRHEWHKHGTCSGMISDDYFQLAARLVEQFNELPAVQQLVQNHIGGIINQKEFFKLINESLGENATKSMSFICDKRKKGQLTEVRINLIKDLPPNAELKDSIDFAKPGHIQNCPGESFLIDAPNKKE